MTNICRCGACDRIRSAIQTADRTSLQRYGRMAPSVYVAATQGADRGLGSVGGGELVKNVPDMPLDRPEPDAQNPGDLAVSDAICDEAKHFEFALRQASLGQRWSLPRSCSPLVFATRNRSMLHASFYTAADECHFAKPSVRGDGYSIVRRGAIHCLQRLS